MDSYLSLKLSRLSCLLIIIVVLLHSTIGGGIDSMSWTLNSSVGFANTLLESLIQRGACAVAVPLFFAISGYLFYRNIPLKRLYITSGNSVNSPNLGGVIFEKYKTRARSLLLPYLIWVVLAILIHYIICHIGLGQDCFLCNSIWDRFCMSPFKQMFLCFVSPTPAWHLWFLRDLIILIIISPIIYLSLKYLRWSVIALIFLLFVFVWIKDLEILKIFILGRSFVSPIFFMLGGYLAMFHQEKVLLRWSNKRISLFLAIIWITLLSAQTICLVKGNSSLASLLHQSSVFIGIAFLWTFYDSHLSKSSQMDALDKIVPYTFFVYLGHFLVLQPYLRNLWYALFGESSISYITCSFVLAIITVLVCIILAKCIKRTMPSFYKVLVGGRD